MDRTAAPAPAGAAPSPDGRRRWARVVAIGVFGGFASGLFGIGGGAIIVPALVLLVGLSHKVATGTSLASIAPTAIAGAASYAASGEIDWAVAGLLVVGSLAGTLIGTRYLRTLHAPRLQLAFALVVVAAAVRLVVGGDGDGTAISSVRPGMAVGLVVVGLLAGFLSGLFGIGGGIVVVPALTILFGAPLVLAKGTSLAMIVPTAVLGTWRNRNAGLCEVRIGVAIGAAGVVAALVAAHLSLDLDPEVSAGLFAVLLVAMAARMAWDARREIHVEPVDTARPDRIGA